MSNKTYSESTDLIQRVLEYISFTGKTITEVAAASGYSRTVLSRYLDGKYSGDITKLEKKLIRYLDDNETKAKDKQNINRDFFITQDAGNIMAICKSCQEEQALGVIVGRSGFGKSKTLSEYAKLDRVAYVECDDSMAARDLVEAIEMSIGLPSGYGSIWKRVNGVKEFFDVNKGYLLVIDEADKLITKYTQKKMEILRTIFDQSSVGLVVAGEPALEAIIRGYDTRFANRIDFYYSLKGLSREEVINYLEGYDITERAIEELVIRASNYQTGCFRLLNRTLRNVNRLVSDDEQITLKIIDKASKMMML